MSAAEQTTTKTGNDTQARAPTSPASIKRMRYPLDIEDGDGKDSPKRLSGGSGYMHTIQIDILTNSGGGASAPAESGGKDSGTPAGTESPSGNDNASGGVDQGTIDSAAGIVRDALDPSNFLGESGSANNQQVAAGITLVMTNAVENRMSAQWDATDFGLLGAAIESRRKGQSMQDIFREIAADGGTTGTELAIRKAAALLNIGKQLGLNLPANDSIQVLTRKVENPFKEQLFKTMNFRSFPMQVKFAPRNSAEMSEVMNILYELEYHMHPERETLFLKYPSEFKITYMYNGGKNSFLNEINTCVLTDMQVNYGHNGFMTSFAGGAPTEITLNLNFKEVLLRDRKQIEKSGGGGGGRSGDGGLNDTAPPGQGDEEGTSPEAKAIVTATDAAEGDVAAGGGDE